MTTAEHVMELLVERIAGVMAVDAASVAGDSRFDEDLHMDSLDRVEVVEGVERALAKAGHQVGLPDDELLGLRTVGEAADRIAADIVPAGEAERR